MQIHKQQLKISMIPKLILIPTPTPMMKLKTINKTMILSTLKTALFRKRQRMSNRKILM